MNYKAPFLMVAAAIAWLSSVPAASAACSIASNSGRAHRAEVRVDSITGSSADGSGTVLASRLVPLAQLEYTCGNNVNAELRMAMSPGAAATAVSNVYSTSVPGLGYRIRWPATTWWPNALRCTATQSGNCTVSATNVLIEFVQTGRMSAGTLPAGTLATVSLLAPARSATSMVALNVVLVSPITIAVNTCAVTSDVRVDLGSHTAADVAAATGTTPVPFSLQLNCPNRSAVSITFDGTAPFGYGTRGLVKNDGTAGGVAVQLLGARGSTGVRLGTATSLGTIDGARTLNYRGRIYRLNRGQVSAGSVEAYVAFTLDVQ